MLEKDSEKTPESVGQEEHPAQSLVESTTNVVLAGEDAPRMVQHGSQSSLTRAPSDDSHDYWEEWRPRQNEVSEASVADSVPPTETLMNTRINAGELAGPSGASKRPKKKKKGGSEKADPQPPFVPWLESPAPMMYASPFPIPNMVPTPPGFQPYIPTAPASQPAPGTSYSQPPFIPQSAPQVHWSPSPYGYPQHGAARRKEVYVAHDPFQKWTKSKPKTTTPMAISPSPYSYPQATPVPTYPYPPPPGPIYPAAPHQTPNSLPMRRNTDEQHPGQGWYRPSRTDGGATWYYSGNTTMHPSINTPARTEPPLPVRQGTYDSGQFHFPYIPAPNLPAGPFTTVEAGERSYRPRPPDEPSVPQGPSYNWQKSDEPYIPPPSSDSPKGHGLWHLLPTPQEEDRVADGPDSEQVLDFDGLSDRQSHSPRVASPRYSPTSPRHSPKSPAYSPTSPTPQPLPTEVPLPPSPSRSSSTGSLRPLGSMPFEASLSPSTSLAASSIGSAPSALSLTHSAASPSIPVQGPNMTDSAESVALSKHSSIVSLHYSPQVTFVPVRLEPPAAHTTHPLSFDPEKQEYPPRHKLRRLDVVTDTIRSWTRRASRWVLPGRRDHRTSSPLPSPLPLSVGGDEKFNNEDTPTSEDEKAGVFSTVLEFTTRRAPTDLYLVLLLFLPSFYFSRVARLFEEAELAMPEIEQMAIRTSLQAQNFLDDQVPGGQEMFPLQWVRLKSTWEHFIDSLLREWKTLNVISALLLSAILTILQIDDAANDYLTRYTALLSFICSLVSLLFGCIYIIRFATMRKTYKAAEWAMEAQESGTSTWWNVFILLALPAIWLTWSILLYVVCIMSYIWRTAANNPNEPPPLSDLTVLKIRIAITILLGLALVYACFILATFRRYGSAMDLKWAARIDNWRLGNIYPSSEPPNGATWDTANPYVYLGGSAQNSVHRDIYQGDARHTEKGSPERPQVHFRDHESYIRGVPIHSDDPPTEFPLSWGEHYDQRKSRHASRKSRLSHHLKGKEIDDGPVNMYAMVSEFLPENHDSEAFAPASSTRDSTLYSQGGPGPTDSEAMPEKSLPSLPHNTPPVSLHDSSDGVLSSVTEKEAAFVASTSSLPSEYVNPKSPETPHAEPLPRSPLSAMEHPAHRLDGDSPIPWEPNLPAEYTVPKEPLPLKPGEASRRSPKQHKDNFQGLVRAVESKTALESEGQY